MGAFDYKLSYRRSLPHVQPAGATFFLTCRLAGSLPTGLIEKWNRERKWLAHLKQTNAAHYARVESDFERMWFAKFESVLDGGSCGPLWLRDERVADQLADSLHYRDGRVCRLDALLKSRDSRHRNKPLCPLIPTPHSFITFKVHSTQP